MSQMTRRQLLQHSSAAALAPLLGAATPLAAQAAVGGASSVTAAPVPRKGRIRQSVSRWCYKGLTLDQLCAAAAQLGLQGIDLLQPEEFEVPARYGLRCTMGYAGAGEINRGLNRLENHAAIEAGLRQNLPALQHAGVTDVITFSGLREGLSDAEGARNTILGLRRLLPILQDHGLTIHLELLNSKRDHPGYMCDFTAWGVEVAAAVSSPHVKLLYDIYHMQIMEGDLIQTIRSNAAWIGHYHTGGVPGRHELDDTQEVQWPAVMRAIVATGFQGYVAHEFVPSRDPLTSLAEAVTLCDV
ncbi:MAG: TIM barrel protein [Acidobacteriota bacterium]|nr:TIM barrel protein [Acidobacteriota bacterium]